MITDNCIPSLSTLFLDLAVHGLSTWTWKINNWYAIKHHDDDDDDDDDIEDDDDEFDEFV